MFHGLVASIVAFFLAITGTSATPTPGDRNIAPVAKGTSSLSESTQRHPAVNGIKSPQQATTTASPKESIKPAPTKSSDAQSASTTNIESKIAGLSPEEAKRAAQMNAYVAQMDHDTAAQLISYKTPVVPEDASVRELITSLRSTSFSSVRRPAAHDPCTDGTNGSTGKRGTLTPSPGLFFTFASGGSSTEFKDVSAYEEIHAYDSRGGHFGLAPVKGTPYSFPEDASGLWNSMSFANKLMLISHEFDDARIEIKGKKFDTVSLKINGEGNSCGIVDDIYIPMTPYTIVTIPMTKGGDIGPIDYDVDGDGVKDMEFSLLFQPSDEQSHIITKIQERLYSLDADHTN